MISMGEVNGVVRLDLSRIQLATENPKSLDLLFQKIGCFE